MAADNEFDAFLRLEISNLKETISGLEEEFAKAPEALGQGIKISLEKAKGSVALLNKKLADAKTVAHFDKINRSLTRAKKEAAAVSRAIATTGPAELIDIQKLDAAGTALDGIKRKTADLNARSRRTSLSSLNVLRVVQDSQFGAIGVANNLQELSLSFTKTLADVRKEGGGLGTALSQTLKPLLVGPFAIPLAVTAFTLLAQNMDKIEALGRKLEVMFGDLTEAQRKFIELQKELTPDKIIREALQGEDSLEKLEKANIVLKKQQEELNLLLKEKLLLEGLSRAEAEASLVVAQKKNKFINAANLLLAAQGQVPGFAPAAQKGTSETQKLLASLREVEGQLQLLSERQIRITAKKTILDRLGLSDEETEKAGKSLDDLSDKGERLLATLNKKGQKDGLRSTLTGINVEIDEFIRRINTDFKDSELFGPLLEAAEAARDRLTQTAVNAAFTRITKEEAAAAKAELDAAIASIQNAAKNKLANNQQGIVGATTQVVDPLNLKAQRIAITELDDFQRMRFEIIRDALHEERAVRVAAGQDVSEIDRQLMSAEDQRTQNAAANAKRRIQLAKAETEARINAGLGLVSKTGSILGSLATLTAKAGEKGLEQQKGFLIAAATAEAIAGGVSAVRAVLATPGLGAFKIPLAFATGASVAASLMAQVRQIRNGGSGSSSAPSLPTGGFTQLNENVNNQRIENLSGFRAGQLGTNSQAIANRAGQGTAETIVAALQDQKVTIDVPTAAKVARLGNEQNRKRIRTT